MIRRLAAALPLRAQLALGSALLFAFALGAGVAAWMGSEAAGAGELRRGLAAASFAAGALSSVLLSLLLTRWVLRPVARLSEYAARWRLGEPWDCEVPPVSPEISDLFHRMRGLMEGLNREYAKEKDLNRFKSQLVSTVSHEFNNALSVVYAAACQLEREDPGRESSRRSRLYRMLKRQSRALSQTVANLLGIARLESGRLALHKRRMDAAAVIRESSELLELLWEEKGLDVRLSLPEEPIPVYADPDALSLVVTNLMSNAIKYTPPGGSVELGLARDASGRGAVRVYVRDTGIGIEPGDRERIFAGGYRSESGRRAAKGFGMGLSLARTIVEAHGGRLDFDSRPGAGSTFWFRLPAWVPARDRLRRLARPGKA